MMPPNESEMYYPISVMGSRVWIPHPPGVTPHALARPRDQIPAGEDIRDRGMETRGPPTTGAPVPVETPMPDEGGLTAGAKAAQMLYDAIRGMPFLSTDFLSGLGRGELPPPSTLTPQTLSLLASDPFLSDQFFGLIRASSIYPESYLAESARFQPRGINVAPSFV